MSKIPLQDMVRIKSSIQKKPINHNENYFNESVKNKKVFNSNIIKPNNKKSKYKIYFVALISVIFFLFALSFLFSMAKVTIIPKVKEISINQNFNAAKDSTVSGLFFDLMVISGEESKIIQSNKTDTITTKATGIVLIYNAYNSSSQVLDIDTRLEGSNGKIYKTDKKITVPGIMNDGNPGSVEVGIHATEDGEEYNSSPLDFKILGFKGTSKYSKFYARSKGEITNTPGISELDKATAISELKATLKNKLLKNSLNRIPNGFVLFKDAVFLDIDDKNTTFTFNDDKTFSVKIKGTLYGFLFDEKKLTTKIAENIVEGYDNSEIYIPNIQDLIFSLSDKENISFLDVKNIKFNLSGTPKIIWKIDEDKFINDIINKKKKDFNQILLQYPNIISAELVIRPFWKTYFPETSENIEVIINYPQ